MAVTSATSTGINVPEIVTGLMEVERAPVKKLEAQIDQKTLVISTLGVFKSKVAALESAAKAIQTPGVFSLRSANSSDSTMVSATATNAASAGTYSVKVAQTAQAAVLSVPGFTATNQVVDLSTFAMTHAGVEYTPEYAKFTTTTSFATDDKINFTLTGGTEQTFMVTTQTSVDQVVSAINAAVSAGSLTGVVARKNADGQLQLSSSNAIQGLVADIELDSGGTEAGVVTQEGLSTTTSISSLTELINALDVEVEANLVQIGSSSYSLSLASTATGAVNDLVLNGLTVDGDTLESETLQTARDAFFSVNGLAVRRASNQIDDVVSGVTFSLNSPVVPAGGVITDLGTADFSAVTSTSINVTKGAEDLSGAAVEDFVNAYNELLTFYKTESISSQDPAARGVLNGDSTLRTFMDRIRGLYANGIRLADGSNISLSSIGVEVQRDGSLFLDRGDLNTAIANGLQDKFARGVTLGYASSSLSLTSFLTSSLRTTGLISSHLTDVETQQTRLEERVSDWEDKLARIEQRYYRQYAALDALLFRLQTTSNALTSAIESLVNSQKSG